MGACSPLKIRLLGELQLAGGDGPAITLPASRKTRALLGYLIATGQAHRRERLCDLLWDGPDDPRAELRWSLSKIRPLLNGGGASLVADRQHVGIELGSAAVDLLSVRSLLHNGISGASTDALKQVASLFHGEFLDGLDLPVCYRYQEWCMAEREAMSRLRLSVLAALVERLHDDPADALSYARDLTVADPLCEVAHAAVVRLLSRTGRNKEGFGHYERASRILETELGVKPSQELEKARDDLQTVTDTRISIELFAPSTHKQTDSPPGTSGTSYFVGRGAEHALIECFIAKTVNRQDSQVVLVTGEAGIGKSHLLGYTADRMIFAGGRAWTARAFEPEAVRPYGIWFDLLRAITRGLPREKLPPNLGILLPEVGVVCDPGDRSRLFDAVFDLLQQVAAERAVALMFDDIHWMDEASSSLLHYVARQMDAVSGLLIVCSAREGEIDDNAAASSALRSLARENRLQKIELGPLSSDDTIRLVKLVDPALDGSKIFAGSEGNPLFTLELARAHHRGDAEPGATIKTVIAGQLTQLTEHAREVLLWAAAIGRRFTPDDLARAARLGSPELLKALGEMERRGVVRTMGDDAYDFTHDLVRQTAYQSVSQPRRKLLHRNIARALEEVIKCDTTFAADLAYHAALADDHEMAARACAVAGDRALRLFANIDACSFAERGLRHVERLVPGAGKVEIQIALLKLRILAAIGPGMRPLPPLIDTVAGIASAAEKLGLQAAAATAHYLLSVLHQEAGDTRQAEASTLRAAAAGRTADDSTLAHQLANTARCLLELETEIGRSRELIREADVFVRSLGLELCELHWARGLLHRWDGEAEMGCASLTRALALARRDEDRWREYKCLTWLAMLEQEQGRYDEMQARCGELSTVAARLGEDETPFVATLQGLALLGARKASALEIFANALERLRTVDDKSYLAYALNTAGCIHLRDGRIDQARLCATEALAAASAVCRNNEISIARTILRWTCGSTDNFVDVPSERESLSTRARSIVLELAGPRRDSNAGFHGNRPVSKSKRKRR
jgi:DNA-binding SARP family transcriptional activator/tetratricopeptide (TPR) repeat protein